MEYRRVHPWARCCSYFIYVNNLSLASEFETTFSVISDKNITDVKCTVNKKLIKIDRR